MAMNVTLVDTAVALLPVCCGTLVRLLWQKRAPNHAEDGSSLLSSDTLVFTVLPLMFDSLGVLGQIFAIVFFLLLTIAALTSSISMLEGLVALGERAF